MSNCDIIASELLFIDGKIFVTYGIRWWGYQAGIRYNAFWEVLVKSLLTFATGLAITFSIAIMGSHWQVWLKYFASA